MTYRTIVVDRSDEVVTVRLNRLEQANSLTDQMVAEIESALAAAAGVARRPRRPAARRADERPATPYTGCHIFQSDDERQDHGRR